MKLSKRLAAFFMAVVLCLGLLPLNMITASATAYDNGYLRMYDYKNRTYSFDSSFPAPFYDGGKSHYYSVFKQNLGGTGTDFRLCYCIEYGAPASSGLEYDRSDTYDAMSDAQRQLLNRALMLGYSDTSGPLYGGEWLDNYMATQVMVWVIATGYYNTDLEGRLVSTYLASSNAAQDIYYALKHQIDTFNDVPSFASDNAGMGPTHEMKYNQQNARYELTLIDANNSLR